jgi:ankyrin repeat protein
MSSTEYSTSADFASIDQFEAARTGNLAWFQHHKAAGTLPDLMLADMDGYYLHEFAARNGHLSVVRYLIEESGQSIDATAHSNFALRWAARHGHLPVLRYLIEDSGQSVDATSENNSAIRLAAANGHLGIIRYLIEDSGQPVDATARDNRALRYAATNGHLSVVRYLVEESGQSVDATADNNYALQLAARHGHLHIVRYLIEESNRPVDVFANDNELHRTAADTSSSVELRVYLETVIPIIESLGLDLAREFFKTQRSDTTKNTLISPMKGRI